MWSPVFGLPIVYIHAFVYSKGSSAKLHREPRGIEDEKTTERSWFVRYLLYCGLDMECCSTFGVNRVRVEIKYMFDLPLYLGKWTMEISV
jgi:hypothetical protein